jgi:hypothetical protein
MNEWMNENDEMYFALWYCCVYNCKWLKGSMNGIYWENLPNKYIWDIENMLWNALNASVK